MQTVYVLLLLGALVTAGLLRPFHHRTPQLFDSSFGSLLGIAFAAFVLMHLVQRREMRDLFPPLEYRGGLRPGLILPMLVILIGEKWLSVDLLEGAYDWIDTTFSDAQLADAVYRLWTGLALSATALLFFWILRQCRHRVLRLVTFRRAVEGAGLAGLAMAGMGLLLLATKFAAGPTSSWTGLETSRNVLLVAGVAQIVRAAAEELFYRGLLQTALVRLLTEAGLGEGRAPRLLAIASISSGFALEHYDSAAAPAANLSTLFFVFSMSCALGVLLEVSRNLYVVIASHAVLNLCIGGILPLPAAGDGSYLLSPAIAGAIFMLLVFAGVAVRHARDGIDGDDSISREP